jgi:hypothetical protein
MTDQTNPKQTLSRRDALKSLAAATGATALSALSSQWETPLVEMGALPAFAQVSGQPEPTGTPLPTPGPTTTLAPPVEYPFTSTIQGDGTVHSKKMAGLRLMLIREFLHP